MRGRVALPLALLLAVAMAWPAAAGDGTFHGRLTGASFTCHGAPVTEGAPEVTGGTWNVNVTGSKAVVTVNVFYDDSHHLSFGTPWGDVAGTAPLRVEYWGGMAVAGLSAGTFTWTVSLGYTCGTPDAEAAYDALVYWGPMER